MTRSTPLGPEDPGDLTAVELEQDEPDDDVIDISENDGPELTVDVDDIDAG